MDRRPAADPVPASVLVRRAGALALRPPAATDLPFLHRLHADPAAYRHYPQGRSTSIEQTAATLDEWLGDWSDHGFGYWIADDARTGEPVGMGGVAPKPPPAPDGSATDWLNLGYRLSPAVHGRGLGRVVAREGAAFAAEWRPATPLYATVRPANVASRRAAQSAGLSGVGSVADVEGEEPSTVLQAPRVQLVDPAVVRSDLVSLWQRVNDEGGAVGFLPHAPVEAVRTAYDRHAADVAAGRAELVTLTLPASSADPGRPVGMAVIERGSAVSPHRVTFKRVMVERVMVEPSLGGRNLGRLLLSGLHATARRRGHELAVLTVRGGTGTEAFYTRSGYREVGRIPDGLKFGDGPDADYRDDIWLARRLDGSPLRTVDPASPASPAARNHREPT